MLSESFWLIVILEGIRDENMIDLAWHQKEFEARRSFAWVIEEENGTYAGCAYVSPSINGEKAADVTWWWRTGASIDRHEFKERFPYCQRFYAP